MIPLPARLVMLALGAALAGPLHATDRAASAGYAVGDRLQAGAASAPATGFRRIDWDALMPKDWDPMKDLKSMNLALLRDGDPQANAALEKLKRAWDSAPTEAAMDGARVRLPGFVVPLDSEPAGLREFLLVPYFGACIHTPPPPSNQVIHVRSATPLKNVRMMDPVWVSGALRVASRVTAMGSAGYAMDVVEIAPYRNER